MYKIFLLPLLLLVIKSNAQNFAEDFKAINKAYLNSNISFNIKYDYYNEVNSSKPSYFYSGVVKLKGSMVYYKMNGVEFTYDSTYSCMLDHENKSVMVDSIISKTNIMNKVNFIDSLTKAYKSFKYTDVDVNTAKYTIYSVLPGVSHCEITYNKSNKLINKISIYFFDNREGAKEGTIRNKLVISYSNINTSANNTHETFKVQKYVNINGKKVTLKPAYQKYSLINNIE